MSNISVVIFEWFLIILHIFLGADEELIQQLETAQIGKKYISFKLFFVVIIKSI